MTAIGEHAAASNHSHGGGAVERAPDTIFQIVWRQRRTFITTLAICLSLAVIYLVFATRIYTASATLFIDPSGPFGMTAQSRDERLPESYLQAQGQLIRSHAILIDAIPRAGGADNLAMLREAEQSPVLWLQEQLSVEVGKRDNVIKVELKSSQPEEARRMLGGIVASYLEYHATRQEDEIARERVQQWSAALVEAQLARVNIDSAYGAAQAKISTPQGLAEFVEAQQSRQGRTTDDEYSRLLVALQGTRLHADQLYRNFGPRHAAVATAAQQVAALEQELEEKRPRLAAAYLAAIDQERRQAAERELILQNAVARARLRAVDDQLAKSVETIVSAAPASPGGAASPQSHNTPDDALRQQPIGTGLKIDIWEPAQVSAQPTWPSKSRVLLGALLVGSMLGVGVSLLQAASTDAPLSREELEHALQLSVVGRLPIRPSSEGSTDSVDLVANAHGTASAEAYRLLHTRVSAELDARGARSLVITSPEAGDGKSTVAANLAATFALFGKRTLLLIADTRRPPMLSCGQRRIETERRNGLGIRIGHARWERSRTSSHSSDRGLVEALEQSLPLDDVICATNVPDLFLLPAGGNAEDPPQLLSRPYFKALLAEAEARFDVVVIDTPPICVVTDAAIMAGIAGATLLVVRPGRTKRGTAEDVRETLSAVGAEQLGIVINGDAAVQTYYPASRRTPDGRRDPGHSFSQSSFARNGTDDPSEPAHDP